jgi:small redox-active disulfide protein 2
MLDIKVLGSGCPNCIRLENLCREAVAKNNLEATIEKVTDFNDFFKYGIMMTPALVVNGKVLSQGKIPVYNTLEHWLIRDIQPPADQNR